MDEKLKYCIGLSAVYGEILFILAVSTNIDLWSPIFNTPMVFLAIVIPNTIAQVIGIPFMVLGILTVLDMVPTEVETGANMQ